MRASCLAPDDKRLIGAHQAGEPTGTGRGAYWIAGERQVAGSEEENRTTPSVQTMKFLIPVLDETGVAAAYQSNVLPDMLNT